MWKRGEEAPPSTLEHAENCVKCVVLISVQENEKGEVWKRAVSAAMLSGLARKDSRPSWSRQRLKC